MPRFKVTYLNEKKQERSMHINADDHVQAKLKFENIENELGLYKFKAAVPDPVRFAHKEVHFSTILEQRVR